jgi:hypothetical protein
MPRPIGVPKRTMTASSASFLAADKPARARRSSPALPTNQGHRRTPLWCPPTQPARGAAFWPLPRWRHTRALMSASTNGVFRWLRNYNYRLGMAGAIWRHASLLFLFVVGRFAAVGTRRDHGFLAAAPIRARVASPSEARPPPTALISSRASPSASSSSPAGRRPLVHPVRISPSPWLSLTATVWTWCSGYRASGPGPGRRCRSCVLRRRAGAARTTVESTSAKLRSSLPRPLI